MSDQVGSQNVGFLVTRLILIVSSVSTSNLPQPGLDPKKLLVLASGNETHRLESGGASLERRGSMRGGGPPSHYRGVREDSPLDFMSRISCILSHYEARFLRYPRLDTQTLLSLILMSMVLVCY